MYYEIIKRTGKIIFVKQYCHHWSHRAIALQGKHELTLYYLGEKLFETNRFKLKKLTELIIGHYGLEKHLDNLELLSNSVHRRHGENIKYKLWKLSNKTNFLNVFIRIKLQFNNVFFETTYFWNHTVLEMILSILTAMMELRYWNNLQLVGYNILNVWMCLKVSFLR